MNWTERTGGDGSKESPTPTTISNIVLPILEKNFKNFSRESNSDFELIISAYTLFVVTDFSKSNLNDSIFQLHCGAGAYRPFLDAAIKKFKTMHDEITHDQALTLARKVTEELIAAVPHRVR